MSTDNESVDDAIAASRWRPSGALGGGLGSASGIWVRVHVVVRVLGRQQGSVVHGSIRVRERVVVSASGQAEEAACKSRDKIRLG